MTPVTKGGILESKSTPQSHGVLEIRRHIRKEILLWDGKL
jgi:hypothetical protein